MRVPPAGKLIRGALLLLLLVAPVLAARARAAQTAPEQDRFFTTSDGARLHYIVAGHGHTIVFVPGWTMPAWIWQNQLAYFSRFYRVVGFDPRGQGLSEVTPGGYNQQRRGQDIAELIARLGPAPVLLVGWSLGVLDSLAYVHMHGDAHIAGLVLVDNSVGENPPPRPGPARPYHRPLPYDLRMRVFVRSMFRYPPGQNYLRQLTAAALQMPEADARLLLEYPVPRTYWRAAIYSTAKPVLYLVRPHLAGQAANLVAHHPDAESVIFRDAGHALFVDDAARFDAVMLSFVRRKIWR